MRKLIYFIRRALRNMRQTPVLCGASIGTVTVSLVIMAFFALVVLNVQNLTLHWSQEIQVVAYLEEVPAERVLREWTGAIEKYPEVAAVRFISRTEAFERFRQRLARDADLLTGLDESILPASLEISLRDEHRNQAGVQSLVQRLKANPSLADLRFGQEWLEKFESFVRLLRAAGAALGGFLLFAALFIISNTIRLTLYARRDELEVMSLVGGTPFFIKAPFLLEGALQGALGGSLALGASYLAYLLFFRDGLSALLLVSGVEQVFFLPLVHQLLLIAAGTMRGVFGSLFSLRRFVRI